MAMRDIDCETLQKAILAASTEYDENGPYDYDTVRRAALLVLRMRERGVGRTVALNTARRQGHDHQEKIDLLKQKYSTVRCRERCLEILLLLSAMAFFVLFCQATLRRDAGGRPS